MVLLSDQGSVQFFKESFQRLRPCHTAELRSQLILVSGKCGGQFGFISSHASNVSALAVLVIYLLRKSSGWWYLMLIWAVSVSIIRVYLGVHYPTDIIAGSLFGAFIGYLSAKIVSHVVSIE